LESAAAEALFSIEKQQLLRKKKQQLQCNVSNTGKYSRIQHVIGCTNNGEFSFLVFIYLFIMQMLSNRLNAPAAAACKKKQYK
jgi:hypothetical protein